AWARARRDHGRHHADRQHEPPVVVSARARRSEEHTSELQSHLNLVCRLLLEKKKHGQSMVEHRSRSTDHGSTLARCSARSRHSRGVFFFNDTATTEIYTLSLHDALPIRRIRPRT